MACKYMLCAEIGGILDFCLVYFMGIQALKTNFVGAKASSRWRTREPQLTDVGESAFSKICFERYISPRGGRTFCKVVRQVRESWGLLSPAGVQGLSLSGGLGAEPQNLKHFYSVPQCSHCKHCTSYIQQFHPSVRSSVTPVAWCSLHCQMADVSSFVETKKNMPQGRPPPPEILAQITHPLLKTARFDTCCLVVPQR